MKIQVARRRRHRGFAGRTGRRIRASARDQSRRVLRPVAAAQPVGGRGRPRLLPRLAAQRVRHDGQHAVRRLQRPPGCGQPVRGELGHRVPGQARLPGHVPGLPHHRHQQPVEAEGTRQLHGLPPSVGAGRRRDLRRHHDPLMGLGLGRGHARRRLAVRRHARVQAGQEGLHVFDVGDPEAPDLEASIDLPAARTPRPACRTCATAACSSTAPRRARRARASTSSRSR